MAGTSAFWSPFRYAGAAFDSKAHVGNVLPHVAHHAVLRRSALTAKFWFARQDKYARAVGFMMISARACLDAAASNR